jgi:hypothetical protein
MTLTWGAYEAGSDGNAIRVGIDLSVSGTTITAVYKFQNEFAFNDSQTSTRSGAVTGSTSFQNNGGAGHVGTITTKTITGSIGSTYTFGHTLSGVYNGATPSVSASIQVPGNPPSAPWWESNTPTNIMQTQATFRWNPPSSNGGLPITAYTFQLSKTEGFGSIIHSNPNAGMDETVTGLTGNTRYYARVKAHNAAGAGPWSSTRPLLTAPTVPSKPGTPTVSNITSTGARLTWTVPTNNGGGTIDYYDVQVDNDPAFGSPIVNVDSPNNVEDVTGLAPNITYYARVRAANTGVGTSDWSGSRQFVTAPNRPNPPTAFTVTRNSDIKHTLNWTNNPTGPAPYANVVVQRSTDGGGYATIATLAATATTYVDSTTATNHTYVYRLYAKNGGGWSDYTAGISVATTPSAPANAKAVRGGTDTAIVTWTNTSRPAYNTTIQESTGPGTWGPVLATLPAGVTSWTDTSPVLLETQYRLRHVTTGNVVGLQSAAALTNVLVVKAPPLAPTITFPNGVPIDGNETNKFTWKHNPVDGSAQTKYQLQYRLATDSVWTVLPEVTSSAQFDQVPAGSFTNGLAYEWQARTWGVDANPSPWSATAGFHADGRPTVTINSPIDGEVLGTSDLRIEWTFFDPEGGPQAAYRAGVLTTDGQGLELRTGVNQNVRSINFTTVGQDGEQYILAVEVQDAAGLWSPRVEVLVTVDYLPPEIIEVEATYHPENGTISLLLIPQGPIPGVSVPAVLVPLIERQIDGGDWTPVAVNVPIDATVIDVSPTTRGTNTYRITIVSALPTSLIIDPAAVVEVNERDHGFISWGPSWGQTLVLECDMAISTDTERAKKLYHFAGRILPLEFAGLAQTHEVSIKGTITGNPTTIQEIETFARFAGIVLWRDPTGRRTVGSVGPVSASLVDPSLPDVWEVSFTLTQTEDRA